MNGKTLLVLANGPSINDAGLERLRARSDLGTLTINSPHPSLWPTTYWLFCDQSIWVERHPDLVASYEGTIITCCNVNSTQAARHVLDFKPLRGFGFSRDLNNVGYYLGRSSTYVALQFACEKQYERVYVFGLDMQLHDGTAFYGKNPDPFTLPHQRANRFAQEAAYWDDAVKHHLTQEERSRIVLCGRADWPFTRHFRRLAPADAVGELLESPAGV